MAWNTISASPLHCFADLPAFLQAKVLFLPSPKSHCYSDHWGREGREEIFLNYLEETDLLEELTKEIEMTGQSLRGWFISAVWPYSMVRWSQLKQLHIWNSQVPAQTRKQTEKYRSLTGLGIFSMQSRMQGFAFMVVIEPTPLVQITYVSKSQLAQNIKPQNKLWTW